MGRAEAADGAALGKEHEAGALQRAARRFCVWCRSSAHRHGRWLFEAFGGFVRARVEDVDEASAHGLGARSDTDVCAFHAPEDTRPIEGRFVFSLDAGETRVDTFAVTVEDQYGASDTRQVSVTIVGANQVPTVSSESASMTAGVDGSGSGGLSIVDPDNGESRRGILE